jgi:hypothetical protein
LGKDLSMSYYDFDEHFWSPKTVCAQSKQKTTNKKIKNQTVLIIFSIISIATTLGLSLRILGAINNNNTEGLLTRGNNSSSNCLFLQGSEKMQVYCSQSE